MSVLRPDLNSALHHLSPAPQPKAWDSMCVCAFNPAVHLSSLQCPFSFAHPWPLAISRILHPLVFYPLCRFYYSRSPACPPLHSTTLPFAPLSSFLLIHYPSPFKLSTFNWPSPSGIHRPLCRSSLALSSTEPPSQSQSPVPAPPEAVMVVCLMP